MAHGKTTFFNCLNEDLEIDSGEFYIEENENKRKIKAEDVGYVLSTPVVPEFLTGREFLKFFIDINKNKIKNLKTIDEYFDFMKIEKEEFYADNGINFEANEGEIVGILGPNGARKNYTS